MTKPTATLADLAQAVTRRTESVFAPAIADLAATAAATYAGARVLISGGAGFIGSETLKLILAHRPALVVIVDTWENGLAELVRQLRTTGAVDPTTRIEPRLVDATSPLVDRVIAEEGPFDVALAFAAAKHVRTERDVYSGLHMTNTNVWGTLRLLQAAHDGNPDCRLFMVSTDKAADPSSLMGASKRLMERAVFERLPQVTTTRFANVAFSNGSLLESWVRRLGACQVLPVPADTSRFFVQPVEAGQLCLASSLAPAGSIVVPTPGTVEDTNLEEALLRVLDCLGERHEYVADAAAAPAVVARGAMPILRTVRDTAGEKQAEIFVGAGETAVPWLSNLERIDGPAERPAVGGALAWLAAAVAGETRPTLSDLMAAVSAAVPEFSHVESDKRLDDRI
ncbi:MAG: polysaccharide biosynthesis protein [Promicromonosporaceae bacterium]|nr:polysaccharide biosynthesis protein [Promicromonosporaceae bacterium]